MRATRRISLDISHSQRLEMDRCPSVQAKYLTPCLKSRYDTLNPTRSPGVLVHCGAGVSRSATLVLAYLMRYFTWSAEHSRKYCFERRSLVNPNDGFWRSLCALEAQLGIANR